MYSGLTQAGCMNRYYCVMAMGKEDYEKTGQSDP